MSQVNEEEGKMSQVNAEEEGKVNQIYADEEEKIIQVDEEEREQFEERTRNMNSVLRGDTTDEIIEINVGGKVISALRSTLTLAPDAMFSFMFSRWAELSPTRDTNDRIFLDHDPELVETIVNFLRMKKVQRQMKSLSVAVPPPKIPNGKKDEFEYLLSYFGLTDFFYPPLDMNAIDVVQPHGSLVNVTKSGNKIQFSKESDVNDYYFVACKPSIRSSGEGSFWKVTIDAFSNNGWLFLGIIKNLDANVYSYKDETSCGWASGSHVYHGDQEGSLHHANSGWTEFTEGECLYFHLKSNKLTMFSIQKDKMFTMKVDPTDHAYYIHSNVHSAGTKLTLEPLCGQERSQFTFKL